MIRLQLKPVLTTYKQALIWYFFPAKLLFFWEYTKDFCNHLGPFRQGFLSLRSETVFITTESAAAVFTVHSASAEKKESSNLKSCPRSCYEWFVFHRRKTKVWMLL